DSIFNSSGHVQLREDITGAGDRGVAMLIQSSLRFDPIDLSAFFHPSWEIQGATFTTGDSTTLAIFNIYKHCNLVTPAQVIRTFFNFSSTFNHALIVGDLNAHHPHWHCDQTDAIGRILFDELDRVDYVVLNEDAPILIQPPGRHKSVIDLAIASPALALITHSDTEMDPMGSDHYPVYSTIGGTLLNAKRFLYKIKLSEQQLADLTRTLWRDFAGLRSASSGSCFSPIARYEHLNNHVVEGAREYLPENQRLPRTVKVKG
ncbi:hypothetical protein ALC62_05736, partial [Cyphomyrmex costatus]